MYHSSDPFILNLVRTNPGSAVFGDQYVILQVFDTFWFAPSWTMAPDKYTETVETGVTEKEILNFIWPEVQGGADDLSFWGVFCEPGTFNMISNISHVTFAFE